MNETDRDWFLRAYGDRFLRAYEAGLDAWLEPWRGAGGRVLEVVGACGRIVTETAIREAGVWCEGCRTPAREALTLTCWHVTFMLGGSLNEVIFGIVAICPACLAKPLDVIVIDDE